MDSNDLKWEEYFIPGTTVLKNKFNIVEREELIKKEVEITFEKLLELQLSPICMNFDEGHLKAIHKYLFEDIYFFAGEYRNVYMGKNNSYFASVEDIPFRLRMVFKQKEEEIKNIYGEYDFACFLAGFYVELLNIHPFREGNGRTIREFIREYANEVSKNLPFGEIEFNWSNVDIEVVHEFIDKATAFRSIIELEFMKAFEKRTSYIK